MIIVNFKIKEIGIITCFFEKYFIIAMNYSISNYFVNLFYIITINFNY